MVKEYIEILNKEYKNTNLEDTGKPFLDIEEICKKNKNILNQ
jgi:hypothetical protein